MRDRWISCRIELVNYQIAVLKVANSHVVCEILVSNLREIYVYHVNLSVIINN